MSDKAEEPTKHTAEEFKEKLSGFFELNPSSRLVIDDDPEITSDTAAMILSPWGDESVGIICDYESDDFIEGMNNLYLPERYSALYHTKSNLFEVAWTAYPLSETYAGLRDRKFEFFHNGRSHKCRYGQSSNELLNIAARFFPREAINSTNYRNLYSFMTYATHFGPDCQLLPETQENEVPDYIKDGKPLSFFIEIEGWNEDLVFDLANHINFFMTYYDTLSPIINIHSPKEENVTRQPQNRMAYGEFPSTIISKKLDDNLLHFWQAARSGDPARRFLYNYQIIEYASFVVIEEAISKSIKELLSSPHLLSSADVILSQILEHTSESKISDPQKIESLFRRVVDPKLIWSEMQLNIPAFENRTTFDGGHTIPALLKKGWGEADFIQIWPVQFANTLRNIRNALSHGREQRMTAVITPTADNLRKLQAWVPLVEVAAREVMVYRHMAD